MGDNHMECESKKPETPKTSSTFHEVSPLCHRLQQYKMTTPPWKETFRMRCFQRLRSSRERLVCRFRASASSGAAGVVRGEWDAFRDEFGLATDRDIDAFHAMYEDLKQDIEAEENRMWEEYLKNEAFEAKDVEALVETHLASDTVTCCPSCLGPTLHLDSQKGLISCDTCQLRVFKGQGFGFDTEDFGRKVSMAFTKHETAVQPPCRQQPNFVTQSGGEGSQELVLICSACGFTCFIL